MAFEDYARERWSVWSELKELVSLWDDTYCGYWGLTGGTNIPTPLSAEQINIAKEQHNMAVMILKVIRALTVAAASTDAKKVNLTESDLKWFRGALRSYKSTPVVRDWIAIRLADEFTKQIDGASDRAFRLVSLVQGRALGERASNYLARVSTLYVGGFELETAVMCRATLETALLDRLDDQLDPDRPPPQLEALIRLAGETGALQGFERWKNKRGWRAQHETPLYSADRIRRAGNFVVHEFLRFPDQDGEIRNAFECIRELSLVLYALFPPPTFE